VLRSNALVVCLNGAVAMLVVTAAYVEHGSIGTKPDAARVLITASSTNGAVNLHFPTVSTLGPERANSEAPGHDFSGRNGLVIFRHEKTSARRPVRRETRGGWNLMTSEIGG
jgi:hypothetical protein